MNDQFNEILTPGAITFLVNLHTKFNSSRKNLLVERQILQQKIYAGEMPKFISNDDDDNIRDSSWEVYPVLKDLQERRVEITGPTERKMVINALNSGANCFMADFEDSNSPTWDNMIQGQINLRDAVNGTIEFTNPRGKHYKLNDQIATLLVRARGWHLDEKHFLIDGEPISGGIFDFGLYFYHNTHALIKKGSGPYFYLPKIQNHMEALLWNQIFVEAQASLGIPEGTIKATVLIEHILAAFRTEEILYALKKHSSGLNCGRWDYIFSIIKTFKNHKDFTLPDRSQITMETPCMEAYCKEVIRACHKRGAHAMGGMAAQIPIKNDPEANNAAMEKVRLDKEREVALGHCGTWVAHPGLVAIALKAFEKMKGPNQINKPCDFIITEEEILVAPAGTITDEGIRTNITVGLIYLQSWLDGNGCVPINNLMEDLATYSICASQLWQWIKHNAKTNNDKVINQQWVDKIIDEEASKLQGKVSKDNVSLFKEALFNDTLHEFLPIKFYECLCKEL